LTTVIFPTPSAGRLFQVEYAIAAIQNAAAAVGIQTREGVVIAGEKKIASKLLAPPKSSEKMYKVDDHVFCAVAGLTSDANILINYARVAAQRHAYTYGEPQPVEQLVQLVCDYKHGYTQHGGLRPFGVSFLFAGWDKHHGFQLYQSDPSGNYSGWKATAIGANSASGTSTLKAEYKEDLGLEEAQALAMKVLTKAMDTTHPTSEKIEVALLARDAATGAISQRPLTPAEVDALIARVAAASASAGDV
jgi:20S proteasome subunit alpha 3